MDAPTAVLITQTQVDLEWSEPDDDGACSIASYSILRDGGLSSPTFIEVHAADVNNKPSLASFSVTDLPTNIVGQQVVFKINALNIGGFSTDSLLLKVIIASVPDAPAAGPASDLSVTNGSLIKVTYSAPGDGGSFI